MSKTELPTAQSKMEMVDVVLETPIIRGEQKIERVSLRKPSSGELRGVQLSSLIRSDVDSLYIVLPRITTPTLTAHDINQLDLVDLGNLAGEVVGFFMKKSDREALFPAV